MMNKLKSVVAIVIAILSTSLFGGVYVKFVAQGGMFAVPGVTMDSGSVPDEVITAKGYADPVRIGYNFAGWSSIANPKTDAEFEQGFEAYYSKPVTKATTFYAIWEQCDPIALDNDGEWAAIAGGVCGKGVSNEYTACFYEMPGRGWLNFKWRIVVPEDSECAFYAYGKSEEAQSYDWGWNYGCAGYSVSLYANWEEGADSDLEWHMARVAVTRGGFSEFVWQIQAPETCCSPLDFRGLPEVQVEIVDISWDPAADFETQITLEPCGGVLPGSGENVFRRKGQYGELPEPEREGCSFVGWSLDTWGEQIVSSEDWLPLESNVVLYAIWIVPIEEIGGDGWFGGEDVYVETKWVYDEDLGRCVWNGDQVCVWSRNIAGPYDNPCVYPLYEIEVEGGGTLNFSHLSCSGYADYIAGGKYRRADVLCVAYVDGERYGAIPLNCVTEMNIEIPGVPIGSEEAAFHSVQVALDLNVPNKLRYDYERIESVYFNTTFGPITWSPTPAEGQVVFDARGGDIEGASMRVYSAGDTYGDLPRVSKPNAEFLGWFARRDGSFEVFEWDGAWERPIDESDMVVLGQTLYARWITDLKTAVGGGKLRFATHNEPYGESECEWFGTSDTFHGAKDTFSAGTTQGWFEETNVLTTVVQGQGLLRFWWQRGTSLTREYYYDDVVLPLTVWVDGKLIASCEVENAWTQIVLPILGEKKNHVVEWKYTPKSEDTLASWAGQASVREGLRPGAWIDDVEWLPKGEVLDIVTWMKGVMLGNAWLVDELPLIEMRYTQQLEVSPGNCELLVLRALTKLMQLGENKNLLALVAKFGLVPDYQVLGRFSGELDYSDAPLSNEVVDQIATEAVPVIKSALADLETIPDDWTGLIALSPDVYPVSVMTYVDLADVTLCKAALKGALSALAVAESYDLSVDYMNIEMEAILHDAGLPMTFEYFVEDHPDFIKRVRDAERLAEGKEMLRDALKTLQTFDGLMLERSTDEMHFFEYNAKDAGKQQYAREEVAKMLAALDGEVEINNDDFRYARDFRIENLEQSATLAPFFAGELTHRYFPTEINGNIPVFDSFPSMAFGGMFTGLTKDIVAGWLAASGYEVEYTPNSDCEPEVRFRTFSAAIPKLGVSATNEEIKDALAGTADEKVRKNVTDSTSYAAFETWASKVRSSGVSLKAVKASPYSWQSFALDTPELIQDEVTTDDLKVEEFKPSSESGKFDFTVSVKDVTVGSEAIEENLMQMIGLEGADSLGVDFKSENVTIKFGQPENGKLKFTAEPKDKEAKSFFMKMKVK